MRDKNLRLEFEIFIAIFSAFSYSILYFYYCHCYILCNYLAILKFSDIKINILICTKYFNLTVNSRNRPVSGSFYKSSLRIFILPISYFLS